MHGNMNRKGLRPPLPSGNPLQTHSISVMVKKLNNISLAMTTQQRLCIPKYLSVISSGAYVTINSVILSSPLRKRKTKSFH